MTTAKLRKHLKLLRVLAEHRPRVTRPIIKALNMEEVSCVCECCFNVLYGNVPLSLGQKRRLRRFKRTLEQLVDKKKSFKAKKQILVQSGAGFPIALLTPILAIASALLTNG